MGQIDLYDLSFDELTGLAKSWGFSPVHGATLWRYLYRESACEFSQMTDLPSRFLAKVTTEARIGILPTRDEWFSSDGETRKYLLSLEDEKCIESVLMKYRGRVTACLSSQVGCAMGCVFCATGQMGFKRHLGTGEIVAQALHIDRALREGNLPKSESVQQDSSSPHDRHERLRNVVFMGMGEPLHNYDAVMKAIDILRDQRGLSMGAKQISVSTVGVVPGIVRMADEKKPISLAVSLHGATQEERAKLVPVAKAWPLEDLMEACWYYIKKLERRIFFEWTLIEGENDSDEHAHNLGRLLKGMMAQVNLIPLNPTDGFGGKRAKMASAERFQKILLEYELPSTIRQYRGVDIAAGCGQLASRS